MRALLISSSNLHGHGYLDHAEPELRRILATVGTVSFVPFAIHDNDGYTDLVRARLNQMGFDVRQVRTRSEIDDAEAIFVGGGNTFRLLKRVNELGLIEAIRARVANGIPYIGSSAGTNLATPSIRTTNDMPIVHPPSFDALGLVPFQINPHYLDPDPASTHKGETREQRILEFHEENATPVVGLREGSMLRIEDGVVTLVGNQTARLFRRGEAPVELPPGILTI